MYFCGVGDLPIVVGEEIGKLSKVNLGSRFAGQIIEPTPPALEFLITGFRIVLSCT